MMVGSLNWLVVLGQYNLMHAAATTAKYANSLREGHMDAMQRVFGYVKNYTKLGIKYDVSLPDFNKDKRT